MNRSILGSRALNQGWGFGVRGRSEGLDGNVCRFFTPVTFRGTRRSRLCKMSRRCSICSIEKESSHVPVMEKCAGGGGITHKSVYPSFMLGLYGGCNVMIDPRGCSQPSRIGKRDRSRSSAIAPIRSKAASLVNYLCIFPRATVHRASRGIQNPKIRYTFFIVGHPFALIKSNRYRH